MGAYLSELSGREITNLAIIVPPVVNALIERYHVTHAFQIIGVVMLVILLHRAAKAKG